MMMMMIGDHPRSNPSVQIPPWEDPTAHVQYEKYLPSNKADDAVFADDDFDDEFRMFEFKVRQCAVARSHDWTECPFAHPGEKARRRDPRTHRYSGGACPDFRRGECRRGDACGHAHGVFEAWLHPARYRTQPCKDGPHCRRRVCFFAHSPDQLRVPPPYASSTSPHPSPPASPVGQLAESMRFLQIKNANLGLSRSPPAWAGLGGIGSPRSPSKIRPGFMSLPTNPIRARPGVGPFDLWGGSCEEDPAMERVESGRELREKIYAKIGKENSLDRVNPGSVTGPDFEWVAELVK